MCKYVIVITVIVRQDVDGHFGTTLNQEGRTSPREFVMALRKALSTTKIYSKETDSSISNADNCLWLFD